MSTGYSSIASLELRRIGRTTAQSIANGRKQGERGGGRARHVPHVESSGALPGRRYSCLTTDDSDRELCPRDERAVVADSRRTEGGRREQLRRDRDTGHHRTYGREAVRGAPHRNGASPTGRERPGLGEAWALWPLGMTSLNGCSSRLQPRPALRALRGRRVQRPSLVLAGPCSVRERYGSRCNGVYVYR